jgi:hypothetical protein
MKKNSAFFVLAYCGFSVIIAIAAYSLFVSI